MKKYIILLLCFVGMNSCSKQLVEKPKSLAVELFYNTAGEVESGVFAVYAALRDNGTFANGYLAQLEAYTDYSYGRGSYAPLSEFQGLDNNNITRVAGVWEQFYLAIRNANIVISKAPEGSSISAADVKKYVAEAKFLRALSYFHLVRNFGGLILRTETNMEEQSLPRSTVAQTYDLIISDLLVAETDLPATAPAPGRASTLSAKTVLADVYFTIGRNGDARTKALEVITANKYSLVPVVVSEDFQKIYGPDVVTTPEEIFYIKFNRAAGWPFVEFAHHPSAPYYAGAGIYGHYTDAVRNIVFSSWDNSDLRKAHNWYNWNIGLGATSYLNRKYRDPGRVQWAANDYPLYRYADLLLIYAEADVRAGNVVTADAIEKLNMVHRRAYGRSATAPSPVDFTMANFPTVQDFLNKVLQERGYETQYEGKRWLDLKRTGRVKEIILATVGKNVADRHLLWPLPLSEMNFNTALTAADQNPGY